MNDDEIRVAIAEKRGWIRHNCQQGQCTNINHAVWSKGDQRGSILDLPDYPNDLNACHEFEKTLGDKWKVFIGNLYFIISDVARPMELEDFKDCWNATASQRCEAFLRVHGLWKDNPTPERSESK